MGKKVSTNDFIQKAKEVHGDKYDYSKTEYTKSKDKIIIICPIHGEFLQEAASHLKGYGCKQCALEAKSIKTTTWFISEAKQTHGDKYDYSKTEYIGANKKVIVTCPDHGDFEIRASAHIGKQAHGCPKCGRILSAQAHASTTEDFIERSKQIHNNYYDYSKTQYINLTSPITIICPEHGEFRQAPRDHLQGCGCAKCSKIKQNMVADTASFIKKASEIYNGFYDYSKVIYHNSKSKVCVVCPIHGEFYVSPEAHLKSTGCPQCTIDNRATKPTYSYNEVVERCIDVHDNYYKYIYYKDCYVNVQSDLEIICPEHGPFKLQAFKHLHGTKCPKCRRSAGEVLVSKLLQELNVNFIPEFKAEFLGLLSYDFYLPDYKIAIEYNGLQHYQPVEIFGGEDAFHKQRERDTRKAILSEKNGIKLITIDCRNEKNDLDNLRRILESYKNGISSN